MAEIRIDEDMRKRRQEAAAKMDPYMAEITWNWGQTMDPYGEYPDLPDDLRQIERLYYARSHGSDLWVAFVDLPEETGNVLQGRLERGELREDALFPL